MKYLQLIVIAAILLGVYQSVADEAYANVGYVQISIKQGENILPTKGFAKLGTDIYTGKIGAYNTGFCKDDTLSVVIGEKHYAFLEFDGEHWRDYHHGEEIKDGFCIPMRDDATVILERHIDMRTQFDLTFRRLDGEPVANKQKEYSPEETPLW